MNRLRNHLATTRPFVGQRRHRGVALITVLLIVFLASVMAVNLTSLQQLAVRRSEVLLHQQQARLYVLGVEQWAAAILARDAQNNDIDTPGEDWATLPPVLPVAGGSLVGRIQDLQGRFNLNNLLKTAPVKTDEAGNTNQKKTAEAPIANPGEAIDQDQFKALLRLLESLEIKPPAAQAIAQAIADWIDPDQEPAFPDGAEDSVYTSRDPPYTAANRPLASVSELRLIAGIDDSVYTKLAPYVCALPAGTLLNVNTAAAPVLGAAADNRGWRGPSQPGKTGAAGAYRTVDDFLNVAKPGVDALPKTKLTVSSRYFLIQAEAHVGEGRAVLHSILERDKEGVRIVARSFGNED